MGKAKKRNLYKGNPGLYMTRDAAVSEVSRIISLSYTKDKKNISDIITLFGLSAEELSEAGVPYENLMALSSVFK